MKKLTFVLLCLVLGIGLASAQTTKITGTVISSEDGEPVIGASIVVKGNTTVGTVTDYDGKFSLSVPSSAKTLVFSYIGMITKEEIIKPIMNIAMNPDVKSLEEVVVTAVGIKRAEKSLAYSASQVGSETITKSGDRSVLDALAGKVAGVSISSASGAAGASTRVLLRGFSSLNGNNQPLFIIDGVPVNNEILKNEKDNELSNNTDFGNGINDINPNDIESMSVLKGASAAALYGSRAANGAIMITTKKGRIEDKMKIDIVSNTTFSRVASLPEFQNRYGQGWGYLNLLTENGSWGPKLDGTDRVWGHIIDGEQLYKPYSAQKNNLKDFYDTGVQFDNSISISGGKDKMTYFMSYSNITDDGVLPTSSDSYRRNSVSLKGSYKGRWVNSSAGLTYINRATGTASSGQGYSVFNNLIQIPRDFSIVDMKDYKNKFYSIDNWYTPWGVINPYFNLNEDGNKYYEDRILGNLELSSAPLFNCLTFTWRGGIDLSNYRNKSWRAVMIPNGTNTTEETETGYVGERTGQRRELNSDLYATFNKQLSEDLHLNVLFGQNFNERYSKSLDISVQGLDLPGFYDISNSPNSPIKKSKTTLRRLMGLYGQADLGFKNYLYLNIGARNDWSSTLPKQNNSFFYPTVGLSFVFTDAFESIKNTIPYGKVRIGYGQTGNDVDPYMIYGYYEPGTVTNPFGDGLVYPFNGVNAYTYGNTIGNPNLKAELSKEFEIGMDLRFLDNRVGIDLTYYNKRTTNQIMPVDVSPSSGYTVQYMNLGCIRNRGLELMVNLVPVRVRDFEWLLGVNWTLNRSKVIDLGNELEEFKIYGFTTGNKLLAMPGQPLGVFVGYGTMKDDKGNIVVDSETGIPLQSKEREIFGTSEYKYVMGINNEFSYRNISFGFNFDIRVGGLMFSRTKGTMFFVGNSPQTLYNDRQPFIVPGSVIQVKDESGTISYKENTTPVDYSHYDGYWYNNGGEFDKGNLIDKTHVKLRDLHLTYSFPKSQISKACFTRLDLSFIAHNLFVWTPSSNTFVDPTVSNLGVDIKSEFGEFSSAPSIRSFGFSIKASF